MKSRGLNFLTALSLLLCVTAVAVWAWSYGTKAASEFHRRGSCGRQPQSGGGCRFRTIPSSRRKRGSGAWSTSDFFTTSLGKSESTARR